MIYLLRRLFHPCRRGHTVGVLAPSCMWVMCPRCGEPTGENVRDYVRRHAA